ncbi:hypothetical protein [Streptomyces sp. NPDC020996]|uniref:non-homologous end-joining DNA ligase LigD n=1 Tax=Streptomyces sp. NPDC020996 TaxID=3154791 RepID=UPI0033D20810
MRTGDDTRTVRAGRRTVRVHRPDKVLFPGGDGTEYTKSDLVDYHRSVGPFMLPHLRGRPLMLQRHPDGIDGCRFMQKNTPDTYPDWVSRVEVPKEGGTVRHTVCDDSATLAAAHPDRLTTAPRKKDRGDRLYLDIGRDAYAQTAVAPYTVRALPGAPVATPIAWSQLDDPGLHARRWTVADAVDQARTDPWAGVMSRGRALGPARRRLDGLRG